jgi:hypothetical protein
MIRRRDDSFNIYICDVIKHSYLQQKDDDEQQRKRCNVFN